ncbi:MAG: glycerol kinase [Clostridiales bacterium]|nr:glycerol kinase [Clostridiales bacterium]
MKKYIIALDQGTTSSRAIIFDNEQNIIESCQKEFEQIYPQPGFVEHDPNEIYTSQYTVMMEAITHSGINLDEVAAIGITNQRETTIVWNKNTGTPICNAIVWQCRRSASICEQLTQSGLSDIIKEKTGLIIDAYFSATKIKWILDNIDGARELADNGELLFGTVDTYLIWKMTNGKLHITDYTNASRTMLFNIRTLKWDLEICKTLNIPTAMLPEVRNSSEVYGYVNISGYNIPIAAIAGDQQAALFGQTCFEKGEAKNTYGTGCFLLMNTGEEIHYSKNGLLTTIAIGIDGKVQYALEGSVFVGGALVKWLQEELGIIKSPRELSELSMSVKDNGGVYIVPAFTGLGAPYWDMYARGSIFGITRGTTKAHIARAAEEAIAYQSNDLIKAMYADTNICLTKLNVDGGVCVNDAIMQFQADITNTIVQTPIIRETTALGVAYLAGLATGVWKQKSDIIEQRNIDRLFKPSMSCINKKTYINRN